MASPLTDMDQLPEAVLAQWAGADWASAALNRDVASFGRRVASALHRQVWPRSVCWPPFAIGVPRCNETQPQNAVEVSCPVMLQ